MVSAFHDSIYIEFIAFIEFKAHSDNYKKEEETFLNEF
jgi:hypothetical protein